MGTTALAPPPLSTPTTLIPSSVTIWSRLGIPARNTIDMQRNLSCLVQLPAMLLLPPLFLLPMPPTPLSTLTRNMLLLLLLTLMLLRFLTPPLLLRYLMPLLPQYLTPLLLLFLTLLLLRFRTPLHQLLAPPPTTPRPLSTPLCITLPQFTIVPPTNLLFYY